jgi:dienelactone hydrolase
MPRIRILLYVLPLLGFLLFSFNASAAKFRPNPDPTPGDLMFENYFTAETARIARRSMADIKTLDDWKSKRPKYLKQLQEMLGLDPMPKRTDLKPVITGTIEHPEFTVENIQFQSRPGLYVTGNLYLPKDQEKPAPTILYVCGHGRVKVDGISYGNKTHYQHHGSWFARHGYVCLVIDTVQLGELEGIHHGTYREKMWWWNSRGYSSAAVEAWNCIRALDYLETRIEVDPDRFGVTGRSGGGAYSWWIASLDERIKAAAPVAGITDLQNHVVDGVVEGHCDCMYHVNTYRWDFAQIASMVAPRALLICNTDDDRIFPLDGVTRLFQKTRRIYELHQAKANLGLVIVPGGHKDTQPLRVPVFNWFDRHLKGEEPPVTGYADKLFEPQQLKVFAELPKDQITTTAHEGFTRLAKGGAADPVKIVEKLGKKSFRGWPEVKGAPAMKRVARTEKDGVTLEVYEFTSQDQIQLRMYVAAPKNAAPESLHLEVIDEVGWNRQLQTARVGFADAFAEEFAHSGVDAKAPVPARAKAGFGKWMRYIKENNGVYVTFTARGIGLSGLRDDLRHQTQVRRRFMLLGQTLDGMRVFDIRRAMDALRSIDGFTSLPLHLWGGGTMANNVLLAAIMHPDGAKQLHLTNLAMDDKTAPDYLNLSRVATWEQLVAVAKERMEVGINNRKK